MHHRERFNQQKTKTNESTQKVEPVHEKQKNNIEPGKTTDSTITTEKNDKESVQNVANEAIEVGTDKDKNENVPEIVKARPSDGNESKNETDNATHAQEADGTEHADTIPKATIKKPVKKKE